MSAAPVRLSTDRRMWR